MIIEHFNLPIPNKEEIEKNCQEIIDEQFTESTDDPYYLDEDFFREVFREHFEKMGKDFKFVRGWFHFIKKDAYLRIHEHDALIGLYYLRLPENSGKLYFDNERAYQKYSTGITPIDKREIIESQEDDFLVFGPNDSHGVTPHQNDKTRLTLGMEFNFV